MSGAEYTPNLVASLFGGGAMQAEMGKPWDEDKILAIRVLATLRNHNRVFWVRWVQGQARNGDRSVGFAGCSS